MKKLSVVAVAVCLFVGSSFAGWDKFGVIGDGSAEMKLGNYDGGWWLGVRYGLMENLELYSTMDGIAATEGLSSNYVVGARYQIIPVLGGFLDLALPTMNGSGGQTFDFGLRPGINFTTNFTDALSFGSVAQLGVTMQDPTVIDLTIGVEVDYNFSDNVGAWVGVDFVYDRLTQENREDLDMGKAIQPGLGFFFTKDNLTVGTLIGLNLACPKLDDNGVPVMTDGKAETTIGLTGGVEFAVKF
jgi:hypothetical protein